MSKLSYIGKIWYKLLTDYSIHRQSPWYYVIFFFFCQIEKFQISPNRELSYCTNRRAEKFRLNEFLMFERIAIRNIPLGSKVIYSYTASVSLRNKVEVTATAKGSFNTENAKTSVDTQYGVKGSVTAFT